MRGFSVSLRESASKSRYKDWREMKSFPPVRIYMRNLLSFLLLIACLQSVAKAQGLHVLDPGKPVEREIAGGESHTYEIKLTAGQFMQVIVEEKATATEPDRKRVSAEQMMRDAAALARKKDFQGSIDRRQQALVLWRELGDRLWEGD